MLDFIKGIQPWVWSVILMVAFMGFYTYRSFASYKKNSEAILAFQNKLEIGHKVILSSGIHGTIRSIEKKTATLEIAKDTIITVERLNISTFDRTEAESKEKTGE